MTNDLLFELGTEELPSASVLVLGESLRQLVVDGLDNAAVSHGEATFYATPRRLAVLVRAVADQQASQCVSRRGPAYDVSLDANGQPTPALIGFAKSCGVSVDALTTIETDKGQWWHFESVLEGAKTTAILPTILAMALSALPIAKPMRWGCGTNEFVRPVHWAVLLLGDNVVPCELLGVQTGRFSYGHRFHFPQALTIASPGEYESALRAAYVIADFSVRRDVIRAQIQSLTESAGVEAIIPPALLDEVTSIVEWPVALMANFEVAFLEVPPEALIASMQQHQKCFALRNAAGNLVPQFITVSNIASQDPQEVVRGNEKVMRARLSDAAFFYRQDKRQRLEAYRDKTGLVLFQAKLGTLLEKSERLASLMESLASSLSLDSAHAIRAAELSKCDLMTGMVGEFPELQGLMGYYYACNDGEPLEVAQALNEYYMPRHSGDALPTSSLATALSLADRMDTLVGAFAIGQKPTGVKDPFKLRRHAVAVIRLLIQLPSAPSLSALIERALHAYGNTLQPEAGAMEQLRLFILDRLNAHYEGQSIRPDLVQAVRAREEEMVFDMDQRIKALQVFASRQEAISLSAACKRVNNILQQAGVESNEGKVDSQKCIDPVERTLFEQLKLIEQWIAPHYAAYEYEAILAHLASLHGPVDAFFEHVMVMVDDEAIRTNRLNLLVRLRNVLQGVADIGLLDLR